MSETGGEAARLRAGQRETGPIIEILDVSGVAPERRTLEQASIDSPRQGELIDSYVLTVAGTLGGRGERPVGVRLTHGQKEMRRGPVEPMSSWRGAFALSPSRAERYRFTAEVGVLGLPPEFELTVHPLFWDERLEPIGRIQARHRAVRSDYQAALQPLMVTSLARTGTTWLMSILGQHPSVVVHRRHPYEMVPGRYWMHLLKVLAEPANHQQSTPVSHFQGDRFRIGHNPFFYGPFLDVPRLRRWFGRTHVERQAAFCQEMIDTYYREVASHQAQKQASLFAEKHLPDHIQWLMWELYPEPREIFLVRDPRDMVASMVAFNEKRGYLEFGREKVATDEEWLLRLRDGVARLLAAWRARAERARLLRYEDLITDPVTALSPILEYLGQSASSTSIEQLVARASANSPELAGHRTSKTAMRSIGRWRQTLDRRWWPNLEEAFGDLIGDLGYA